MKFKKKKKDIHLVQSRRRLVRVRACICLHLCMSYLCVHLRHWAAGYAALKGCVSAAISLSLSLPLCVSRSHLDSPTCFVCCLYRSPSPFCPSVFHYQCFIVIVGKSTRRNVGGLSHSQPFTSSTGNDLMLFEREAG